MPSQVTRAVLSLPREDPRGAQSLRTAPRTHENARARVHDRPRRTALELPIAEMQLIPLQEAIARWLALRTCRSCSAPRRSRPASCRARRPPVNAKVLAGDVAAGDGAVLVELPASWLGRPGDANYRVCSSSLVARKAGTWRAMSVLPAGPRSCADDVLLDVSCARRGSGKPSLPASAAHGLLLHGCSPAAPRLVHKSSLAAVLRWRVRACSCSVCHRVGANPVAVARVLGAVPDSRLVHSAPTAPTAGTVVAR